MKKLLDLPEDVVAVLSVHAAKNGKSVKSFMQSLLISAASELQDVATNEFLSKSGGDIQKSEVLKKLLKEN